DTYMWTPEGVELVSHGPDGTAIGGRPPLDPDEGTREARHGTISKDGRRVFFERYGGFGGVNMPGESAGVYNVYMREEGEVTLLPLRKGGDTPGDVRFMHGDLEGENIIVS